MYNTIKKQFEYVCGYCTRKAIPCEWVGDEPVKMVTDLPNHKSSRCWVLYTGHYIYLQSYNTIVSCWDAEKNELRESKHSTTTSKQQTWFRNFLIAEGHNPTVKRGEKVVSYNYLKEV